MDGRKSNIIFKVMSILQNAFDQIMVNKLSQKITDIFNKV